MQLADGALEPTLPGTGKEAEAADFSLPGWQAGGRIEGQKGGREGSFAGLSVLKLELQSLSLFCSTGRFSS